MSEILIKALSFVAIIVMGNLLRRRGYFRADDFHLLSKIVLKITLPAAIISNFSDANITPSLLFLSLLGLGGGILFILAGLALGIGRDRGHKSFLVLNLSGYNIGNFTLPFAQSFLGPAGVITTSLFDAGNSIICLGGAYSVASMIKKREGNFSLLPIIRTLLLSVPFDAYLMMTVLSLLHLSLPTPITTFAGIISNANAFLAMLMMGIGFQLSGDMSQIGLIVKVLAVRYGLSILICAGLFFLLPLPLEYRQALAILVFSPIASAAPAFTASLNEDFGLASAINSISIVISLILITITLLVVL